jgi:chromosome segregation ATPase
MGGFFYAAIFLCRILVLQYLPYKICKSKRNQMQTDNQVRQLRSENELLHIQLDDVNMMIKAREDELDLLRAKAREAVAMQSKLDNNLNEFEQMQHSLGNCQQKNAGHSLRLQEMEEELYLSIKEQLKYAESLKTMNSLEANLLDTTNELQEASEVYRKVKEMKTALAATNSQLEIALLEIESLKAMLQEAEALNVMLRKNR